jgi:GT2 family glycosyltransferase
MAAGQAADRPVSFALSGGRPARMGRGQRLARRLTPDADRRAATRGEVVVTDRREGVREGLAAGRAVIAVGDRDLASAAPGDVVVVKTLTEARDELVDRLGPGALTAEALRYLPPRTAGHRGPPALVTVLVPARNAAADIARQLNALAAQDYSGAFEVVVADNGSTDGTPERARAEAAALGLDLRVVDASDVLGVSHARNAGCRAARGALIAVCDADDVVAPEWLAALVEQAQRFDMVGGAIDLAVVNPPHVVRWRMLPERDALPTRYGFLPYAHGCNVAVWRDVWERSGGWDESIRAGCDDIEYAWRLQLAGHALGMAPDAVVHYRLRDTLAGHARQSYGYHRNAGLLVRRFRGEGARPSRPGAVAGELLQLLRPVPAAPWSVTARALVVGRAAALWGRIRSSLEYRTWAL